MITLDNTTKKYLTVVALVIILILIFSVGSKINQNKKNIYPPNAIKKFRTMIKQSAQYASMSEQDKDPVYSFMHANSALNYFMVVRSFLSDKEIKKISGINSDEMQNYLQWLQEKSLSQISQKA